VNSSLRAAYTKRYLQVDVRYRGTFLCRAVPVVVVSQTLHRVIKGWLSNQLRKASFEDILRMVNKLISVFKPTEKVRYAPPTATATQDDEQAVSSG
jgi:hypothetical protein